MKTSSSSTSPIERSSWRCVPSPQSNSRRSPPRRTSVAGRPRRGGGRRAGGAEEEDVEVHAPYLGAPGELPTRARSSKRARPSGRARAHRVGRRPAALGRAARVEDLEAVVGCLVQRQVRVAEDHGVGASAKRAPHPLEAAGRAARVVDHRDPRAVGLDHALRRQRRAQLRASRRCRARPTSGGPIASSSRSTSTVKMSPACRSRSAAAIRSTQASGSRRPPRGMCVSEMTAISIAGSRLTEPGARSSVDRALPSGGRSRRFESCRARRLQSAASASTCESLWTARRPARRAFSRTANGSGC